MRAFGFELRKGLIPGKEFRLPAMVERNGRTAITPGLRHDPQKRLQAVVPIIGQRGAMPIVRTAA